ncbi:hypothetical protein COU54_02520 [Candidatus Pacearchaeota archaeon CG10_big_fil_rev_8_21_14_0_10_31_24]|nr:MAG: hypothetical protein COU54_02520 [Candidatus Pacearchaeota archaeon CG10_big_fil_rev_8_21_14_0_10_31_24]
MAEENKKPAEKKSMETTATETKFESKVETSKVDDKKIEKKNEVKETSKSNDKPKKIEKKDEAITNGKDLSMSKKHGMYIAKFIKYKTIAQAIADLELVIKFKKVVPFKGEIPHRKGKGMMSGRYPIKASKMFITMLKSLRGNVLVNGMDLDKTKIYLCSSSWASRPRRAAGVRFKRSNIIIRAKEFK